MLKVLAIVDKENTALDRLAKGVAPYHDNLEYKVISFHPKRPDAQQMEQMRTELQTTDIIDAQYFRTIEKVRELFPESRNIPTILTHNNPYSITESDWNDYDIVVGNNKSITSDLSKITTSRLEHIPIVVDPFFWQFNDKYTTDKSVIMVANRIESKKGILPVAKACQKLGIKMHLVGAISQPDYWREVMETGVVHFAQEISDEDLRKLYYASGLHVCNSVDNFESGTMPILEAMFCGVPVITRKIGHVPDFYNEDNLVINDHDSEDVDHLVDLIRNTFADANTLEKMRQQAWYSIKDRTFERRAYAYQRLYRELLGKEPVSVIVPVAGKPEVTRENLNAIANQTHQNIEIVVIDDGEEEQSQNVQSFAETVSIPVRYIRLGSKGYHLAKARNMGAIEATSDILVFADQRMILEPDTVSQFVRNLKPNTWLYGNKGVKKEFVENLSCVERDTFFTFGGFNERMNMYGGLSQETRSRARRQGIQIEYVEDAKATPRGKSSNKRVRRYEIMQIKSKLWKMRLY
jgi:glycosyltransferase involved in cell wall biosynthesis